MLFRSGGRFSNASVIEAIGLAQEIVGEELEWRYEEANRIGDHIWWIGNNGRFESHYPDWKLEYDVRHILEEIRDANSGRWQRGLGAGAPMSVEHGCRP